MEQTYYEATDHSFKRYKKRMAEHVKSKFTRKNLQVANKEELAKRTNFMLLFSIHGRPGATPNTEVRYYFDWDIVVDNKKKTIVTVYPNDSRRVPPAHKFGDRKIRQKVYSLWFKPNSKIRQGMPVVA